MTPEFEIEIIDTPSTFRLDVSVVDAFGKHHVGSYPSQCGEFVWAGERYILCGPFNGFDTYMIFHLTPCKVTIN